MDSDRNGGGLCYHDAGIYHAVWLHKTGISHSCRSVILYRFEVLGNMISNSSD